MNRRRGFTLMELLFALALASIVITICYAVLLGTMKAQATSEEACRWTKIQAAVFNIISTDIGEATIPRFMSHPDKDEWEGPPVEAAPPPEDVNPEEEEPPVPILQAFLGEPLPGFSDGAGISFVVARPVFDNRSGKYYLHREISYFIRRDERTNANLLIRREQIGWDGNMEEGGSEEILCDIKKDIKIEYYDGIDWLEEWKLDEKGDLPIAVRFKISFYIRYYIFSYRSKIR